jgi:hypothetical protein
MNPSAWTMTTTTVDQIRLSTSHGKQEDCTILPNKENSKPKKDCGEMNPNDGTKVD